ncbi:MAG: M48 family metallopeptidase [Verrucomicrobiota bacterium JB022]|nr:M48 family metallopeptidase [Verrucomicrobiota bacterium JB022]
MKARWGAYSALLCLIAALPTGCIGPTLQAPAIDAAALETETRYQQEAFLHESKRLRLKLFRASYPLFAGAVAFGQLPTRPSLGILLYHPSASPENLRAAAEALWPMPQGLRIWAVAPGSPAEAAGLRADDLLLAVDDASLPDGPDGLPFLLSQLTTEHDLRLTIRRGEEELTFTARPQPIADVTIQLSWRQEANARASFTQIEMQAGMIRFCETDAELSFVIAHELAHVMLHHVRKTLLNYATGTLADAALMVARIPSPNALGLAGATRYAKEFEIETDYLSLYLLAASGLEIADALPFWRRIGLLHPPREAEGVPLFPSHPDTAERYLRMEAAIEEIRAKEETGQPLFPTGWVH